MSAVIGFAAAIFLGRCRKCKRGHRIQAPVLETKIRTLGYGRTERVTVRRLPSGHRVEGYDRIFFPCLGCGHSVEARILRGEFKASEVCGSRCMGAVGPACSCSCGGQNHGKSFA